MSTSEERASKKTKPVDNQSGTIKYCTYGHECSSRTRYFLYPVLLLYDRPYTESKIYDGKKHLTYRAYSYFEASYYVQCSCCLLVCGLKKIKNGQKLSRGVVHRD